MAAPSPGAAGALITNARHPRVRNARRLAKRAFRHADRRFLVEGAQGVGEALAEDGALLELFVTDDAAQRRADLVASATAAAVPVHRVSGGVMESLAQTVTPSGIVGVAAFRHVALPELLTTGPRLLAVLVHARDPGNAGTVIRTADAAGADGVILTDSSVDPYNAKCARATAGSLFHLPFAVGEPVQPTIESLRAAGLRVLAATADADTDLDHVELSGPTAWIFGNEAWGLGDDVVAHADLRVRVPIHGRAESLNLATAAAVCLYASARAQRQPGGCRA